MKMFFSNLALHTLINNRRQYISLFTVCVVGIALMLSAVWITDGMLRAVEDKSRIYYGGDLVFMVGMTEKDEKGVSKKDIENPSEKMNALKSMVPADVNLSYRIEFDARETQIFFEGASIRQRMFKGVDFSVEKPLLSRLNFIDGGIPVSSENNSILISEPASRQLGVKAGDVVVVQVKTDRGYTNTLDMYVSGIFVDSSLFGMYTAYLDIASLRTLIDMGDNFSNRICLYYPSREPSGREISVIQKKLESLFNMYPLTDSKTEFNRYARKHLDRVYALITLDANIKDLQMLIDALKAVVLLVIVVLVAIISVGMGSTYRITVMKRITEIGTYRAIGMKPSGVKKVFFVEALYLLVAGFFAGMLVTFCLTYILSLFDFSFIPAFDIFLIEGKLSPFIKIVKSLGLFLIIAVTTILSMLFTIRNVVHISPVSALATTT
ncbi:MAG: FtsX-like permease family protein [Treponema sp.]|nr:FtsX-like permease family protein [Treponema sp.]